MLSIATGKNSHSVQDCTMATQCHQQQRLLYALIWTQSVEYAWAPIDKTMLDKEP